MFHFSLGWSSLVNRFLGPKQAQRVLLGLADPNLQVSASETGLTSEVPCFTLYENILIFTGFASTIYMLAVPFPQFLCVKCF